MLGNLVIYDAIKDTEVFIVLWMSNVFLQVFVTLECHTERQDCKKENLKYEQS